MNHVFSLPLYEKAFSRVFENDDVMDFVHAALGHDLRFFVAHALWSPTVDYELYWHRDFGDDDKFSQSGASTHVQFNVCLLDDVAFRAVPGSHRRPLSPREQEQLETKGLEPLPGEVVAACTRGDIRFMNARTLHRGSCTSGRVTSDAALQTCSRWTNPSSRMKFHEV